MIKIFAGNEPYIKDKMIRDEKRAIEYEMNLLSSKSFGRNEQDFLSIYPFLDDYRLLVYETDVLKGNDFLMKFIDDEKAGKNIASLLVIKCDSVDKRSKIYKSIPKNSITYCNKLSLEDLETFMVSELGKYSKSIEDDAMKLMLQSIDYFNNEDVNLYSISLLCKQLSYACENAIISRNLIEEMISDVSSTVVWDLTYALAAHDYAKVCTMITKILDKGESGIAVLSGLLYSFRIAYKAKFFNADEIGANFHNNPFLKQTKESLQAVIKELSDAVNCCKSGENVTTTTLYCLSQIISLL